MNMETNEYEGVLDFWFGKSEDCKQVIKDKGSLWWKKDVELDQEILQRFAGLYTNLAEGYLDAWKYVAESRLAMIILADQFSS